jgi:hypothetical protein
MATYYRRDDDVQNGLGEAMPNIAVTYYAQPGGALAAIYADSAGTVPIANPQYTNGLGQAVAYLAAGTYTITFSGAQIQTLTYPDQVVGGAGGTPGTNTPPITPVPAADGTVRIFTLSQAPPNPVGDQFFVAGSLVKYGLAYTVSGTTLTWIAAVPPQEGDTMEYFIL